MSALLVSSTDVGAPALTPSNGSLNAVLWFILAQKSWTREFTGTNADVFRAASGNRRRLWVRHDSAISGNVNLPMVRGAESAASATSCSDLFPTVAQQPNSQAVWHVADNTSLATPRSWFAIVTETAIVFCNSLTTTDSQWGMQIFGDLPPSDAADVWNTVCSSNQLSSPNVTNNFLAKSASPIITAGALYWCRDISGTVKSSLGVINGPGGAPGALATAPAARGGYANRIVRQKAGATCIGGASASPGPTSQLLRGWIPNFWLPIHANYGALSNADTWTDTAYDPLAVFRPLINSPGGWAIMELTDTWSPPGG